PQLRQAWHRWDWRAPFLDPDLVAFMLSLPEEWLIGPGPDSFLLRKTFRDLIPVEAPPPAFRVPLERWLRGELRPLVQDTLLGPALRSPGLFDPAMLQSLAEDQEPLTPAL